MKKLIKKVSKSLGYSKSVDTVFFTKDHFKNRKFKIGEYTYGKPKVLFENDSANLYVGKYCSISHNVTIFLGGNHRIDWVSTYPFNILENEIYNMKPLKGHPATKGDVIIGSDVWIGRDATILSGVTIGNGAVIGAGAVVVKDIGDYEIWAGNPARFIKKRFSDKTIIALLDLQWWNWPHHKVVTNIKKLCSTNIESLINEN